MSLDTNIQHGGNENPNEDKDPLGRDLLKEYLTNGKSPMLILNMPEGRRALEKFSWFNYLEQKTIYKGLPLDLLRLLKNTYKQDLKNKKAL